jgi:hypothetical protein
MNFASLVAFFNTSFLLFFYSPLSNLLYWLVCVTNVRLTGVKFRKALHTWSFGID